MEDILEVLTIPDVHGEIFWKEVAEQAIYDGIRVIFLGDYIDTRNKNITPSDCYNNLLKIILLKKMYPDMVTLLLGNHDLAYVFDKFTTTGYQATYALEYQRVFNENWELFDLAWGYQGKKRYTLFTHAGLTKSHYENIKWDITHENSSIYRFFKDSDWQSLTIVEVLNLIKNDENLLWEVGHVRRGQSQTGSIIWADKSELTFEPLEGIDQVVGHTCGYAIEVKKVKDDTLYFVDNWYHSPLLLTL